MMKSLSLMMTRGGGGGHDRYVHDFSPCDDCDCGCGGDGYGQLPLVICQ